MKNTTGHNWSWGEKIKHIKRHLDRGELKDFLNWSTIRATMYVGDAPHIKKMHLELQRSDKWERWKEAIRRTDIGKAPKSKLFEHTNGSMIVNAYHLYLWERVSGCSIDKMESIVEFGGGYGALCLICHRMGFNGTYHIIDFDEMSVISDYYLQGNGVNIVHEIGKSKFDLMVAIHSISEATPKYANSFLKKHSAKHHMIGGGYMDEQYIRQMFRKMNEYSGELTYYLFD